MIAEWMVYSTLCAAGISLAALLAERALLSARGPVRWVWIAAVLISVLLPAAVFRFAVNSDVSNKPVIVRDVTTVADAAVPGSGVPTNVEHVQPQKEADSWRVTLARYDTAFAIAWITLSLAVAINFAGGIISLARMRRRWQQRV